MYGKNVITKKIGIERPLDVQEIFYTIQGEGPFSGRAALFCRLAYCNLRCVWCDTEFSSPKVTMTPQQLGRDLVMKAKREDCDLVVITGGEPMLWNLLPVIDALDNEGITTQIETNGTLWVEGLDVLMTIADVAIVVSPKTPNVHPMITRYAPFWKYVIPGRGIDPEDGLPIVSTQSEDAKEAHLARPPKGAIVFIQPCDYPLHIDPKGTLKQAAINNVVAITKKHKYLAQVQTHKVLGVE